MATTNRSNWIGAAALMENNPYDGHTLSETLTTVERVTGMAVTDARADKDYRGYGSSGPAVVLTGPAVGRAPNGSLALRKPCNCLRFRKSIPVTE